MNATAIASSAATGRGLPVTRVRRPLSGVAYVSLPCEAMLA